MIGWIVFVVVSLNNVSIYRQPWRWEPKTEERQLVTSGSSENDKGFYWVVCFALLLSIVERLESVSLIRFKPSFNISIGAT